MNRLIGRASRIAVVVLVVACVGVQADVKLPHIFGSHMVLQRDRELPVWGWAAAAEKVEVKLGDAAVVTGTADAAGRWQVKLPATPAGGPMTLTVKGANEIVLDDVLVGEVWLCSGQSNMEMTVGGCVNAGQEIADAKYPLIRQIKVPNTASGFPLDDCGGAWQVCSPETAGGFTAAGYFMARELHRELKVPIGLINSSWGGTLIEPWIPPEGYAQVASLDPILKRVQLTDPHSDSYKQLLGDFLKQTDAWLVKAREALPAEKPLDPAPPYPDPLKPFTEHQQPTALYNAMIHPLIPFGLRGAIWYQGESNHGETVSYTEKMKGLIGGWRQLFGQGDFPFYYVQIAPYSYGDEDPNRLAAFWEAQAAAMTIPHTGMVVTTDITDLNDIHPKNKQDVGRRLALWALAKTYGREVVSSGPTFKSLSPEGDKLRVRFDNVGRGLASRDGKPLTWFEIVDQDTDFTKADAVIDGDSVVLSSPEVKAPVAMRFGWSKVADPNLMNKEGLPAIPFRAGQVPERDWLALKVPEAKDYTLLYALDLKTLSGDVRYAVDNREKVTKPFDRIAYFIELQKPAEPVRYLYVSLDAFTADLTQIGVPTVASKAVFQQPVANMNVLSNVQGIVNGNGLAGGNIEFWPHNYGPPNSAKVPNASDALWDFGDQFSDPVDGYGCMQVHNHDAKQTLFAVNNWKSGGGADLGIGNSEGQTRDWTFARNADSYTAARLKVLVRVK